MRLRSFQPAALLGLIIVALMTGLRLADPELIKAVREVAFDHAQRLSPRQYEPVPVRIVDIDEHSLKELGQWPWPRTLLARLLGRLGELGASVVAFDVLFPEPDRMSPKSILREYHEIDGSILSGLPDNDDVFAAELAKHPTVLGFAAISGRGVKPQLKAGFAFTGESPIAAPPRFGGATLPIPVLENAAAGIGDISMNPDSDSNVVRTIAMFLSDGEQLYPSLTMETLRVAQGASTYVIANAPEREGSISAVRIGDFEVPTTGAGELQMYMGAERADRYVSASDILNKPESEIRPLIEGNIVLVGTSAAGLLDIRATTLGQNVPGVSLHAQAIEQILTKNFLSRPDWADGAEVVCVAVLGLIVVLLTALVTPWVALVTGSVVAASALMASWILFRNYGLLLDATFPVATAFPTQFAVLGLRFLTTDRDKRHIRRAFGQYVSPGVLARVESQPEALRLGGEDREITMMFMDVRGFTSISERMAPTSLVGFLNRLLGGLSGPVIAGEGTLDKFIGDSIMAFWNAPVDVADHPLKAARCALRMRQVLREMNGQDAFGLGYPVAIGIGINTGIACVGNMGSENRFNYSAVGDAVNVTARIESACKDIGFDILVSEATAARLPGFALLDAGFHSLKGKSEDMHLFLLAGDEQMGATADFQVFLKSHDAAMSASRFKPQTGAVELLATAAEAARAAVPGLDDFYARLGQKLGVMMSAPAAEAN